MPELPEVETIRRRLNTVIHNHTIKSTSVHNAKLRWPIAPDFAKQLSHATIHSFERRAKYLLMQTDRGIVIIHLGMSGSLTVNSGNHPLETHTHVEFHLKDGRSLRYRDPRRFGSMHWIPDKPLAHPLLRNLGPEPLDEGFNGDYLYQASRNRRVAIKNLLMNSRIIVGIGNIYASEALYLAQINPIRRSDRIACVRYQNLARAVKSVLESAILAGGTTLRDYVDAAGNPGYFKQNLLVYGRQGALCNLCQTQIRNRTIGQRSSYYCPHCQR